MKIFLKKYRVASINTVPPWRNRKHGLHLLSMLVGFFLLLCLFFAGCANGVFGKKASSADKWTCNREADAVALQGDYETGIVLHKRFLEKYPDNGLALYHIGFAHGQMGAYDKEVSYYQKAIRVGFKDTNLYFNLGMAYGELGRLEKSVDAFKEALDLDPKSADNHFGLAVAYQSAAEDILAENALLNAIEIDSGHVDARLHLGMLYADRGDFQKAREQLDIVLEIDPTHDVARQSLNRLKKE